MAVDFKVDHTRSAEYRFAPEQITVKPELNGRHDVPNIQWLIKDILEKGQLQPVIVRNDGGQPVLVAGFSRWRAVSEINKQNLAPVKLTLRCSYFKGTEAEGFLANISENRYRNATTPLDDAHNIAQLERWGMDIHEIAAKLNETEPWVRGRLALVSLCDESREAVKDGRLKPTAAAEIAKLTAAQQKAAVNGAGKISVADAKAIASGKPKRAGMADVKTILRSVIDERVVPGPLAKRGYGDAPEELVEFCAMLLDMIGGKQWT